MKWYANKKMVEISFEVGHWVYLRLQPYKQFFMDHKKLGKLAPCFYGPFQIVQKVGDISYKVDLPANSLIYVLCFKSQSQIGKSGGA